MPDCCLYSPGPTKRSLRRAVVRVKLTVRKGQLLTISFGLYGLDSLSSSRQDVGYILFWYALLPNTAHRGSSVPTEFSR